LSYTVVQNKFITSPPPQPRICNCTITELQQYMTHAKNQMTAGGGCLTVVVRSSCPGPVMY